jgi:lipid-A-disaccharide synthase
MIIAGEASGDLHGAKLVNAMRKRDPKLSFCGIGGNALREAGVEILTEASTLSVVGITEVFSKLPGIFRGMSAAKNFLRKMRPDLLILIDFPEFNLHIAGTAKRLGIPVLYYISPQIWAWRSGRVRKIGKLVNHIAVILPFEETFYRKHKIPVTFVGHPLLDGESANRKTPSARHSISDKSDISIGLLPGSRDGEVARHLPVMLETANILSRQRNDISFTLSLAPSVDKKLAEDIISQFSILNSQFSIVSGAEAVFERCSLVIAASGTVTLQAAIAGVPMVIMYKVSPISYLIGRAMIKVDHICLVNLIAGKSLVSELIQHEASPENISAAVLNMISNPARLERMRNELLGIRHLLGGSGASEKVAEIALTILTQKHERDESAK